MGEAAEPFIGSEALAGGMLNRYQLRRYYRAIMPNVYLDKRIQPTLRQRTVAAWLWSHRGAVIAGMSAAALYGARWIDDDIPVELIWANARAPSGVITRADRLLDDEVQRVGGLPVTTPERTAFDVARRDSLGVAVARLDALAAARVFTLDDVTRLAGRHRRARGVLRLPAALGLVDAGAESPKETWLRLLLIDDGFPRPRTQIPVLGRDGRSRYYLDMGWEEIMLAVEYDGDVHRLDRRQYVTDMRRAEELRELGWTVVRVVAEDRAGDVLWRVRRARDALTQCR